MNGRVEQLEEMKKRYAPKNKIYGDIQSILDNTYTEDILDTIQSDITEMEHAQPGAPVITDLYALREFVLADIASRYPKTSSIHRTIGQLSGRTHTHDSRQRNIQILNQTLQSGKTAPSTTRDLTIVSKLLTIPEAVPMMAVPSQGCIELFDPCTREPIANGDISILESRVKEIKKQRTTVEASETVFPPHIRSRFDLLLFLLNRSEPTKDYCSTATKECSMSPIGISYSLWD